MCNFTQALIDNLSVFYVLNSGVWWWVNVRLYLSLGMNRFSLVHVRMYISKTIPITKVYQHSHIKADATPVMNKSFEKLLSNNFQVIIFERMAKKYFKVNILYKIC